MLTSIKDNKTQVIPSEVSDKYLQNSLQSTPCQAETSNIKPKKKKKTIVNKTNHSSQHSDSKCQTSESIQIMAFFFQTSFRVVLSK
jgi:hypothetical protein